MLHVKEGLEGIVAARTLVSLVDGEKGHLVYRGEWANELAQTKSFEEVAYLLWYKRLPTEDELAGVKKRFSEKRTLANDQVETLDNLPDTLDMMSVIRTVVSSLGTADYGWPSTIDQAVEITALLPTIVAHRYRRLNGLDPIEADPGLSHVANYLYMLNGDKPTSAHVKALTGYLILTMEHGMNASTFTARVIASTQSDLSSAITGAIGAMKGPLHGGAPSGVIDLLDEIGTIENAEPYLRKKLENGERLMGFGHRIYKTHDPRSVALQKITSSLSGDDPWFALANHAERTAIELLEEYKPGRKLYTNVEFYAAAILRAVSLPVELFTATFTISRVVGWIAHVFEQNENNRIIRPASEYIGPLPEER